MSVLLARAAQSPCGRCTLAERLRSTLWHSYCNPVLPDDSLGEGKAPGGLGTKWRRRCTPAPRLGPVPWASPASNEPALFPTDVPLGRSRKELPAGSSEGFLLRLISKYRTEVTEGDNQPFILAGWASMACPVTQLPWAAFQSLRTAVAQDALETKGPWTQMLCAEAVTNST